MDFDKPKVYGDTSITDGLVLNLSFHLWDFHGVLTQIKLVSCQNNAWIYNPAPPAGKPTNQVQAGELKLAGYFTNNWPLILPSFLQFCSKRRGWEEPLDRDLMDRFVNPPAHLSEHGLWCCRQGVEVATWSPCSWAQPRLQSSKDAFLAHEVHQNTPKYSNHSNRLNLSDLSILKKFVGGTVSNVQALPILKT